MAWTQADIDALDAAYKDGAGSVSHDGKSISWRSIEEYKELREMMLAALRTGGRRVMSAVATHSRS